MRDLVIIGTGPAGLCAAIYASRYKMDFVVIGKEIGGQVNENHLIENYPGFSSISGLELGQKFFQHAKSLGAEIVSETVVGIEKDRDKFVIRTDQGIHEAKNIIFALGSQYRRLNIPGEDEFKGKGVSYCATCDAPFFKNKKVIVVGGGNSAASAALLLSEHASRVLLFYRGTELRCDPAYLDKMKKISKIEISCCINVKEIKGKDFVQLVALDHPYEGKNEVETQGVFIEIGSDPSVDLLIPLAVEINKRHFIVTKQDQSTNIEGIYAAGDVTTNSNGFRQIVTAAAEGAVAAESVFEKIKLANFLTKSAENKTITTKQDERR